MKTKILTLLVFLSIGMPSCYYDIAEELYPPTTGTCDTTTPSNFATVNNLLTNYGCMGCHSGGAPSGGVSLSSYTGVKTVAQNGKLMGAINNSPGFSPMPQGGNKMNSCDINKIKAWIDAGALQN